MTSDNGCDKGEICILSKRLKASDFAHNCCSIPVNPFVTNNTRTLADAFSIIFLACSLDSDSKLPLAPILDIENELSI